MECVNGSWNKLFNLFNVHKVINAVPKETRHIFRVVVDPWMIQSNTNFSTTYHISIKQCQRIRVVLDKGKMRWLTALTKCSCQSIIVLNFSHKKNLYLELQLIKVLRTKLVYFFFCFPNQPTKVLHIFLQQLNVNGRCLKEDL